MDRYELFDVLTLLLHQGLWCDGGNPAERTQRAFTLLRDVSRQGKKNEHYQLGVLPVKQQRSFKVI